MQTNRFASKSIAKCYPLPCTGPLNWERSNKGFKTSIPLNQVQAGQLLIPCLSIPYTMARFSVRLEYKNCSTHNEWLISPGIAREHSRNEHPQVSTHIDYFHIHQPMQAAVLVLEVFGLVQPKEYLLVLAFTQPSSKVDETFKARRYQKTQLNLPSRSQMEERKAIRDRICSPTCIHMLLEHHGLLDDKHRLFEDCFDSSVDLYGVWPLNIAAASKRGLIGAVESFNDFKLVCSLLEKNIPLVCSIRFDSGMLQNAPLDKTAGHLVILAGLDGHSVNVYDPAANSAKTVLRKYLLSEFHNAWIHNYGIAYVLVPCGLTEAKDLNITQ